MASTEASSGHASALAGSARGDDQRGPRRALSDRLPRPWLFPLLIFAVTWALIAVTWKVADAIYGHDQSWTVYFLFKDAEAILVPDGERHKQLPTVVRIYDALVRANADRASTLVTTPATSGTTASSTGARARCRSGRSSRTRCR